MELQDAEGHLSIKTTDMGSKKKMRKLTILFVAMTFSTVLCFAQASGSFNASGTNAACEIGVGGDFSGGAGVNLLTTTIQTSNGQGVTLLIRPSLVTGLFTDTKITTSVPEASADIGIQVCLTIDGSTDGILSSPCVVYDQRFQQISTNLFDTITECATATEECNFDLILSTLSAHSYDFIAQVPNGSHTITATWSTIGQTNGNGNSTSHVDSCVGPGVLTVTQTKVFQQNGTLGF